MCAIVDASVIGELWDSGNSKAGRGFRRWVEGPNGSLVVGGKLTQELDSRNATRWIVQLNLAGKLITIDNQCVDEMTASLEQCSPVDTMYCESNDHHIIALARISGARLLFSNDKELQQDFKNPRLVNKPRGTVYSTLETKTFAGRRRKLLSTQRCIL